MAQTVVEIASPSGRSETSGVLRAVFFVGLFSALYISASLNPATHATTSAAPAESPFLKRFRDLDQKDQRTFRAVQEGLTEAERARGSGSSWPTIDALVRDGIPPFAPDPIDKDGYRWKLLTKGRIANYVGTPSADSQRPTFVLIVTEADPGWENSPPVPVDEVHHQLTNRMPIHVGTFVAPGVHELGEAVPAVDFNQGWQQILTGSTDVLGR